MHALCITSRSNGFVLKAKQSTVMQVSESTVSDKRDSKTTKLRVNKSTEEPVNESTRLARDNLNECLKTREVIQYSESRDGVQRAKWFYATFQAAEAD